MQADSIQIRETRQSDLSALLSIYAPYVRNTAISFEYEVPSEAEFAARIEQTQAFYPWLAAEQDGRILGYAYAAPFKPRAAYARSVETTIYLDAACRRQGTGRLLYQRLEDCLAAMNILNLNACIALPEGPDEYLTTDSAEFHTRMGYRLVGEFRKCGYKFGRWYNMIWMEKWIGDHPDEPEPVLPFPAVRHTVL